MTAGFCGGWMLGVTPAIRALEAAGVAFSLHEYDHDPGTRSYGLEAASVLGLDPDQVFKTLLVTADGGQAVAVVPVSTSLSLKAVGAALGRKRVTMCDPIIAQRVTGYVLGGISPFGQRTRLPTVVDETSELLRHRLRQRRSARPRPRRRPRRPRPPARCDHRRHRRLTRRRRSAAAEHEDPWSARSACRVAEHAPRCGRPGCAPVGGRRRGGLASRWGGGRRRG